MGSSVFSRVSVVGLLYFASGIGTETWGTVMRRIMITSAPFELGEMVLVSAAVSHPVEEKL